MHDDDDPVPRKLIGVFILALVLAAGARVFTDLQVNPSACELSSPGSLDLANLELLQFSMPSGSSPGQDLRNSTFWSLVYANYARNIADLVPQTVLGYLQNSATWKNWTAENMFDPPSWIDAGPIPTLDRQFDTLQAEVLDSASPAEARGYVMDLADSVAGYTLAALDFVTFNGLTSLKTLFDTGSTELALCASFPGQLAQLYDQSFDPNVSSQDRAQSLGSALAITSVMALLGGLGGFSDKFQLALADSGLAGVWDTVKPSLAKIGEVSPAAADLTLGMLQRLAERFPNSIGSEAGLVTFRIESMVQVLHDNGDDNTDIEQKVSGLAEDVDSSPTADTPDGPDYIANLADDIGYEYGHALTVIVGEQNHLYSYTDASTKRYFDIDFMKKNVQGFVPNKSMFFKVYYFQDGAFTFNYYAGGETWTATVPPDLAKPGDILTIYVQILTESYFVESLPKIELSNVGFRWMPQSAEIDSFSLNGNQLTFSGSESPSLEGRSTFSVQTTIETTKTGTLQFAPGQGPYLQMTVTDFFGQTRGMRIYFAGYGDASLRIQGGAKFTPVSMMSYDGVRLSFVYGSPTLAIATIYVASPAGLYDLGAMAPQPLDFDVPGISGTQQIQKVGLIRQFENNMLAGSSTYAYGRLGAEIAYTVATEKLGLSDVILSEPSKGGPDLTTGDGKVVLEARLLTASASAQASGIAVLNELLQVQLSKMVYRIANTDFKTVPTATTGYAILTYLDSSGDLHTIVLEVLKK